MPLVIGSTGQISPQDEVTLASQLVTITTQGQARGGSMALQEAGLARSGLYAETRADVGYPGFSKDRPNFRPCLAAAARLRDFRCSGKDRELLALGQTDGTSAPQRMSSSQIVLPMGPLVQLQPEIG